MARRGGRRVVLGGAALAVAAYVCASALSATAFAPFRAGHFSAAVAAGALLAGTAAVDVASAVVPADMDATSIQIADYQRTGFTAPAIGGIPESGGLDGTYKKQGTMRERDFVDDEVAIKKEEKFEKNFDTYVGEMGVLFVGAFIAPMATYFWYVRDTDPWKN
eukprot:TRINITY_DN1515_c0_g1_i1.p1 TRINITY_DN1515_c0_g1~~TRINITY_DN1515_c0_g1_i1.p1  ORF type:complete len:163 (-),score=41.41 TRINITY_DN1515_c0_g1_i1:219-707(-)